LLVGAIAIPTFLNKPRIVDYVMMIFAAMNFTFGAGAALLLLSFVPGDSYGARVLEGASGLVLLFETWKSFKDIEDWAAIAAGYVLRDVLSNVPVASWPLVFAVLKAINAMQTPATTTAPETQTTQPPKA
jgi:hypothetical protein